MMSKKLFCLLALLSIALGAHATQVLLETHQEGVLTIPEKQSQSFDVVSLGFSTDTACCVQFSIGGHAQFARIWLVLDGSDLPPTLDPCSWKDFWGFTYSYLVAAGEHSVVLKFENSRNINDPSTCQDYYLQALIFLPDEPSAVAERPDQPHGDEAVTTRSVLATGAWVSAPGATELWDASGRKVSDVPQDGRISLQELADGTYFARNAEQTILKVVRVQ